MVDRNSRVNLQCFSNLTEASTSKESWYWMCGILQCWSTKGHFVLKLSGLGVPKLVAWTRGCPYSVGLYEYCPRSDFLCRKSEIFQAKWARRFMSSWMWVHNPDALRWNGECYSHTWLGYLVIIKRLPLLTVLFSKRWTSQSITEAHLEAEEPMLEILWWSLRKILAYYLNSNFFTIANLA